MNLIKSLKINEKLVNKYPELVLCGSVSLLLTHSIPPREPEDLDYIVPYGFDIESIKEDTKLVAKGYSSSEKDTYKKDTYEFLFEGTKVNLFVPVSKDFKLEVVTLEDTRMIAPYVSLAYKKLFNRPKDIKDGI